MPPRQPLRIPRPKKAAARAAAKAGTPPVPSTPSSPGTYPNLAPAILLLQQRRRTASATTAPLLDKWLASLTKLQTEITRFQQLEGLATSLTRAAPAQPSATQPRPKP